MPQRENKHLAKLNEWEDPENTESQLQNDDELSIFANTHFYDVDMGRSTDIATTVDELLMQQEKQLQYPQKSQSSVHPALVDHDSSQFGSHLHQSQSQSQLQGQGQDQLFSHAPSQHPHNILGPDHGHSADLLPSELQARPATSSFLDFAEFQEFSLATELPVFDYHGVPQPLSTMRAAQVAANVSQQQASLGALGVASQLPQSAHQPVGSRMRTNLAVSATSGQHAHSTHADSHFNLLGSQHQQQQSVHHDPLQQLPHGHLSEHLPSSRQARTVPHARNFDLLKREQFRPPSVLEGRSALDRAPTGAEFSEPDGMRDPGPRSRTSDGTSEGSPAAGEGRGSGSDTRVISEDEKRRRNTEASARFRFKKKLREQEMERNKRQMQSRINELETQVRQLQLENRLLKKLVNNASEQREAADLENLRNQVAKDPLSGGPSGSGDDQSPNEDHDALS